MDNTSSASMCYNDPVMRLIVLVRPEFHLIAAGAAARCRSSGGTRPVGGACLGVPRGVPLSIPRILSHPPSRDTFRPGGHGPGPGPPQLATSIHRPKHNKHITNTTCISINYIGYDYLMGAGRVLKGSSCRCLATQALSLPST